MKEYEDTNESIHMIYFFMPDKPNLDQAKIFFEYLNNLNKNRKEKNLPQLPIFFVLNCKKNSTNKDALKLILKNYEYLREKKEEDKNKREKLTPTQRLELLNLDSNKEIIEDNIIELELLEEIKDDNKLTSIRHGNGLSKLLKTTKFFIQAKNPFYEEDFNKLKNFINKIKELNLNKKKGEKLTSNQENDLEELKYKCQDLIHKISQENFLLSKLKNENEILKTAKIEAEKEIDIKSKLGLIIGMMPVPYLDIPILYLIYYRMIINIGNCFDVSSSEIPNSVLFKLIFGFEANATTGAKFVNLLASFQGESLGKELIYDMGEEQVLNFAKSGLHVVKSGGVNANVEEIAENLIVKNEGKFKNFLIYIYNLFPSFNKSAKNGIETGGQQLGKKLEQIIVDNSKNLNKDFIIQNAKNEGKKFGEKLVGNANGYLNKLTPKIIPLLGSAISGAIDYYSIKKVGENSIKYFEDCVKTSTCSDFIVKRKEEYEKILNSLEILANDSDNQKFKINIVD